MDRNKLESNSLTELTKEIEKLFLVFNNEFFKGKLPLPVITIQAGFSGKRKSKGWFIKKIWNPKDNNDYENVVSEINLGAEILTWKGKSETPEVAITLLHEMIHQYNFLNGIKDVSENGIHLKKTFGTLAEKSGLVVEYVNEFPRIYTPDLNKEGMDAYKKAKFNEDLLNKFRIYYDENTPVKLKGNPKEDEGKEQKEKKKKLKNLFCPECDRKCYVPNGSEIELICKQCSNDKGEEIFLLENI